MSIFSFWKRWSNGKQKKHKAGQGGRYRFRPWVNNLESRWVPNGYIAIGAGPGGLPKVAIRVDIQDQLGGSAPNGSGQPATPRSDGKTDYTTQIFLPFTAGFRGGVHVATGNFDGVFNTPDELVTAAGPGGGPHVIIWATTQNTDGSIVVTGIKDQFYAFDARFRGGVNVTSGDLDGDGRAELICAAGPGGGPHVRIYKEQINGKFVLVNEFFAYAASFRGGVSVASNQGYARIEQVRQVLSEQLPDDFSPVPYFNAPTPMPGQALGIPLIDSAFYGGSGDAPIPVGGFQFFSPSTLYGAPNGNTGSLDDQNVPLPYITVGSGQIQYLSANPLNSFGNTIYRPDIFIPPQVTNEDNVGELYFASWTADSTNRPAGFAPDRTYGPFVKLSSITTADGDVDRVTRLTPPPGNNTLKSVLVTGAGPGGGPHVRVWSFDPNGNFIRNNGVVNEFFAFAPTFTGGINVSIGDSLAHNAPGGNIRPGRIDYTQTPPVFIFDDKTNSGPQQAIPFGYPLPTELYVRNTPEITVSMATGGNTVRIFADLNVPTVDPSNPQTGLAPSTRTSVGQVNYVTALIDEVTVFDPNNPLGGYNSQVSTTDFKRGQISTFLGGISSAQSALTFAGSANSVIVGSHPLTGTGGVATNPVLGQSVYASGASGGSNNSNIGARVRIFNQMSVLSQVAANYQPVDDFDAFNGDGAIIGASIASGFGPLAEQSNNLDIVVMPNQIGIQTVTDPVLVE